MSQEDTATTGGASAVRVAEVRFEHHLEALGIGEAAPRLSWRVETAVAGWRQTAYEVEVRGRHWSRDTRRVEGDESVLVPWPFDPLASRGRVEVRVRVWDGEGSESDWSDWHSVELGLLGRHDWSARFITPDWSEDASRPQPSPLLRREFAVRGPVTRARLYLTAHGVYEAELNGQVVGDHVLAPGWTTYDHRLRYQTLDVTGLLREGPNALGATLGDGWYRGRLAFGGGRRCVYGEHLALLAQLEIAYADGTTDVVVTDESWRAARGPILASELYDGEIYDARLEKQGWSSPGYNEADWTGVRLIGRDLASVVAPNGPPVRRTQLVAPVAITTSPSGETLVDFGQNLVGRLRIAVSGEAGQKVTLRHAEVLERGELATRPLRNAKATDEYTLKGGGTETWEPRFTFHGFRYAEVSGWPGDLRPDDLRAVVCHSDLERTGWFECSDALLNQLHENAVWSMRGNFLDVPTDCPQRDERLGWTGDLQVFSPTASFLYDVAGFLTSWLADLAAEQEDGAVPFVVPNVLGRPPIPATAWGDAAAVVPWVLYQRFGDKGILSRQLESMRGWVDRLTREAGERRLWDQGFQFGDWLDPSAPPDQPDAAKTDPHLIATAYLAHSADLVAKAAHVLGEAGLSSQYQRLAAEVRAAFVREYVTAAGRLMSDAQTAYAVAIQFALLPDEAQRRRAGERLAELVRTSEYRIGSGFVGTSLILDALCAVGEVDVAYRLLTQRECPSWLYPVTMGATTIWERWDSMLPDGSVNPGEMTSFNHYAFGAVADWLHRRVAGLAPSEPGYRKLEVRPYVGGGITWARARHVTPYGLAECAWKVIGGRVEVEVTVPPNASAVVTLPLSDQPAFEIAAGAYRWSYPARQAPRKRLTLDSTLGEAYDDPGAWAALVRVAPEVASLRGGLRFYDRTPLRKLLAGIPGGEARLAEVEAALKV